MQISFKEEIDIFVPSIKLLQRDKLYRRQPVMITLEELIYEEPVIRMNNFVKCNARNYIFTCVYVMQS